MNRLGLVLDASGIINLAASGRLKDVKAALNFPLFVVEQAGNEVKFDPREPGRAPVANFMERLYDEGIFIRAKLSERALDLYVELVGAETPDDLDDGEAATIAYALSTGLSAVIDESKARALCRRRFPDLVIFDTPEIFRHPDVVVALGSTLNEAVFDTLRFARMRVGVEHDGWVRELIGPERLAQCPSLRRRRPTSRRE